MVRACLCFAAVRGKFNAGDLGDTELFGSGHLKMRRISGHGQDSNFVAILICDKEKCAIGRKRKAVVERGIGNELFLRPDADIRAAVIVELDVTYTVVVLLGSEEITLSVEQ